MTQLTPDIAAAAAAGVYGLREDSLSAMAARGRTLGVESFFDVGGDARMTGSSGIGIFRASTGFGYVARGREGTPYAGDLLIATRGTHMPSAHDWLSNFNIALETGPGIGLVHAGFNRLRETMLRQLDQALEQQRGVRAVHTVGHSLGGALAVLNAADLKRRGFAEVNCYTFGAPRVGDLAFTIWFNRALGANNIRRVYHPADPVPMIPLFPFFHAPLRSGIALPNTDGALVNPDFHSMGDVYRARVAGQSWAQLSAAGVAPDSGLRLQAWLAQTGVTNRFVMGSARLLGLIADALAWVIRTSASVVVGGALTAGATLLDRIAQLIESGAAASIEIGRAMQTVIGAIFRFLGRAAVAVANMTAQFLRWILGLLFNAVATAGRHALEGLDRMRL